MLASLIRQAAQERSRLLIIASLGLAIYIAGISVFFRIAARYTSVRSVLAEINRFLFWKVDRPASFDVDWFNVLGIAIVLPAAVIILCILLSNYFSLPSAGGGGIALLLSYPTTRAQIFFNIFFYQAAQNLVICALSAFFLVVGILVSDAPIQVGRILGMGFGLWLLCLFFSLIAFFFGNITRNYLLEFAISVGLLLLAVLIYLLPGFTHLPSWLRWISPLSPYLDGNPMAFGIKPLNWLVQTGWVIAVGLAAWLHFERTDLT